MNEEEVNSVSQRKPPKARSLKRKKDRRGGRREGAGRSKEYLFERSSIRVHEQIAKPLEKTLNRLIKGKQKLNNNVDFALSILEKAFEEINKDKDTELNLAFVLSILEKAFKEILLPLKMKQADIRPFKTREPLSSNLPLSYIGLAAATPFMTAEIDSNDLGTPEDLHTKLIRDPRRTFIISVGGDSMTDVGIQDQDELICEQVSDIADIQENDIVVAVVGNDVVVKRFSKKKGEIALYSENKDKDYPPIKIALDSDIYFKILGLVTYSIHKVRPISKKLWNYN